MNIIPFVQSSQLGDYEDKLVDLYMADAALNQTIPDSIRSSTEWLLRLVNCFYSNRIEGNPTHPKDLLKTQERGHADSTEDPADSVIELLVHLEAQIKTKEIASGLTNLSNQSFIKQLHESFYKGLPESFLIVKDKDGNEVFDTDNNLLLIKPGEYRTRSVQVGAHIPLLAIKLANIWGGWKQHMI